jgi:hypothetical protein
MPGGGDCEGATGAIAVSRDMELSSAGRKSAATSMDAKPANTEGTVAGGVWGLAVQQLALSDSQGLLIWEQQRCIVCCAGSMQAPTESSNIPTRVMATAVRWLIRHSMAISLPCMEILAVTCITGCR